MKETVSRMELLESSPTSADALTLRNVLLATDFSKSSARALNYALKIAGQVRRHIARVSLHRPHTLQHGGAR